MMAYGYVMYLDQHKLYFYNWLIVLIHNELSSFAIADIIRISNAINEESSSKLSVSQPGISTHFL